MKRHPLSGPRIPYNLKTAQHHYEAAIERYKRILSVPFQKRAEWLVKQIQHELPNVGGLVYYNGDSWLVPVGYPYEYEGSDVILMRKADGSTYYDSLRGLLDDMLVAHESDDMPDVSARCIGYLQELAELCAYCQEERLDVPTTI